MPRFRVPTEGGVFEVETDVADPTEEQLLDLVNRSAGEEPDEGPGLVRRGLALGARIGGPVLGSAVGFGLGGPLGAAGGAAAGGAAGEAAAKSILGEEQDATDTLLAAGLSVLPAGPFARAGSRAATVAGKAGLAALEGATQGVLATGAETVVKEGRPPTVTELLEGAAGGGVVGGAVGAVVGRAQVRARQRTEAPPAADYGDDIVSATARPFKRVPPKTPSRPAGMEDVPDVVQRIEEPGVKPDLNKPQGFYTSPADVESPHQLGGERTTYETNPGANILRVDTSGFINWTDRARGSIIGESSGIATARKLLGDEEVRRLAAMKKGQLAAELSTRYPGVVWEKYFDGHEMLEAVGATEARARGYDALWGVDKSAPEYNEYVGLTPKAFGKATPSRVPPTRAVRAGRAAESDAHVDRLYTNSSPEAKAEIKRVYAENPDVVEAQVRGEQTWARTRALADRISFDPEDVVPGMNPNAEETLAARNLSASLAEKVADARSVLRESPGDPAARAAMTKAHSDFVRATIAVRGFKTEQGRALNALKIAPSTTSRATTEGRFVELANDFGATPEDITAALDRAGDDPLRQYRELLNLARPDAQETLRSLYVVNLLANPKTLERNAFGNALRFAEQIAIKPAAAAVDVVASAVTGREREIFAREAGIGAVAAAKSFRSAGRAAMQVMRQGFTDEQARAMLLTDDKFEIPKEFGGVLRPLNVIGRTLNATDAFFRLLNASIARDTGAYARARRLAASEGQGKNAARVAEIAAELSTNPPADLLREIEESSARSVFREDSPFASQLNALIKTMPLPARAVTRLVMPFIRTPANLISQGFQHTPVGFVTKKGREAGRLGTEERARAALGTVLLYPLAELAASGDLSGSAPRDDAGKRDAFLAEHPENSVRIGDTWYQYSDLGPLAVPLTLVANAVQTWRDRERDPADSEVLDLTKRVFDATLTSGQTIFDASYLSGVGELLDAVQDPKRSGEKFIQRRLSSLVPGQGLLRAAAQYESDVVRQPKSLTEAVQANVPGLQEKVPARLDAFGQPVTRGNVGARALVIPTTKAASDDPVRAELSRLGIEPEPAKSTKEVDLGGRLGKVALSRENDFALRQAKGQAMRAYVKRAIASPVYQAAGDERREEILTRQIKRAGTFVSDRAKHFLRRGEQLTTERLLPPFASQPQPVPEATEQPAPVEQPTSTTIPKGPPSPYDDLFAQVSEATGVDATLLKAVAHTESRYNPAAVGPRTRYGQAVGMMQLLPSTAKIYAKQAAEILGRAPDLKKALDSLVLGALYYRDILGQTSDAAEAARLYHGGPNLNIHGPKTREYGELVAGKFRAWRAGEVR